MEGGAVVGPGRSAAALALAAVLVLLTFLPVQGAPVSDRYGVAVIVGNRDYSHEDRRGRTLPAVEFAHRDADGFRRYVIDVLGFLPENIIDLRDATKAEMETAFGNAHDHRGRLWRFLHPRHGSDVVVFYSGHGVPGARGKRGYLLPANADPNSPELNGYPIDLLYGNLAELSRAKSVRVYIDACFSGDSDKGMLLDSASPAFVSTALPEAAGEAFSVLTAASGEEIASWDEEAHHGLFTHHLLDALYGKGDADGDGQVTAREAKAWLDDHMTYAAQRRFGRIQNAGLSGNADLVLARAGTDGTFPERPVLGGARAAAAAGAKEAAGAAAARTPSEILLPDGLRLSDWVLLAEDRLAREDYRALLVEGTGHLRNHGLHASVKSVVDRALAGLAEGLEVRDEASARSVLDRVGRLRAVVGERAELAGPEGVAHWLLGRHEAAAASFRSWLSLAEADHSSRRDVLRALQRAEAGRGPGPEPDEVETSLGLTAGDRRSIQRGLASLGFGAGAADGVFGDRTREAVSSWQSSRGAAATGYLTGAQAETLKAADEKAQLAAAERARKAREPAAAAAAKEREAQLAKAPGRVFRDCESCPEMVVVPSGRFTMGSPASEEGRDDNEGPQHRVTISRPFAVGKYEVTFEEWDACVRDGGCSHTLDQDGRGRRPVIFVTRTEARAYVRWLSRETGKEYRLLSEAEWEYAARAGTQTRFSWGDSVGRNRANCNGCGGRWDDKRTAPVGSFGANGFGLYDMHGNVSEMVEDCWHGDYSGAPSDGSAWTSGAKCNVRVLRGGSWYFKPEFHRSAYRRMNGTKYGVNFIGFRVARTLDP